MAALPMGTVTFVFINGDEEALPARGIPPDG
jgi:hypothetical protein